MKGYRNTIIVCIIAALVPQAAFTAEQEKTDHQKHGMKDPMAAHLAEKSGAEFEAGFLGMMTLHHEDGVKMAKMAIDRAKNPELKQLMEKSAVEQQKEIGQMTGWLEEWYKKSPSDFKMPEDSKKMMEKQMAELKKAEGAQFDKLFSKDMAHHHMGAIEMSKLAVTKAEHKEVKDLAQKIIDSQTKEREKLLQLAK